MQKVGQIGKYFLLLCHLMCWVGFASTSYAAISASRVEFFVSNNTQEIDPQTAFNRLMGGEEVQLRQGVIHTMQRSHIQQGQLEEVLGTYQMPSDQHITADNTVLFVSSPYEALTEGRALYLARELAILFNQDSVAVFMPSQKRSIGEVKLYFTHPQSVVETIALLRSQLPAVYAQAFSLFLSNTCGGFNGATVQSIEWLGGKIKPEEVQNAFPSDRVTSQRGEADLIYQDGRRVRI